MWKHLNSIKCEVCKTSEYYDLFLKVVFKALNAAFEKMRKSTSRNTKKLKEALNIFYTVFKDSLGY